MDPHGIRTLRRTWSSFLNLFVENDPRRWDRSYTDGQWTFLDSPEQRPRHYVIAGMLASLGGAASSVLDVGCGTGALVPHLPPNVSRYVGIDLSAVAIRLCRGLYGTVCGRDFVQTGFDEYGPAEGFDAIVFNEVLYYYRMSAIPRVLLRARRLLAGPTGTIIVSVHDRSLKRHLVWRRLQACLGPVEAIRATDLRSGSAWHIRRYDAGRTDVRSW